MNDLWPDFNEIEPLESNNALRILREQSRNLGERSKNKVKATFSKIQYTDPLKNISSALNTFVSLTVPYQTNKQEVLEDELKEKENISEKFKEQQYKFEIYNSKYRYRLFVYSYYKVYPNKIIMDENIAMEIGKDTTVSIESDQKLIDILRSIFTSRHVGRIIRVMMSDANDEVNN